MNKLRTKLIDFFSTKRGEKVMDWLEDWWEIIAFGTIMLLITLAGVLE